jgi:hypothetical protein
MRRQSPVTRFGQVASASFSSLGSGAGLVYMLVLLLLLVLFVLVAMRGKTPQALEKVFAAPPPTERALAERHTYVAGLMNGAWLDPADGKGFVETEGYRRLLAKWIDNVVAGEIVANPPLFDRKLAMSSPDLQRSEQVRLQGKVNFYGAHKLDQRVFQLDEVWRVYLGDNDGDNVVVVDVVAKPPHLTEKVDLVEIDAAFYRLVRYETENGSVREVPYLLARNLRVVPDPNANADHFQSTALLLLMIALGCMVVWGLYRVLASRPRAPVIRWRAPHIG